MADIVNKLYADLYLNNVEPYGHRGRGLQKGVVAGDQRYVVYTSRVHILYFVDYKPRLLFWNCTRIKKNLLRYFNLLQLCSSVVIFDI